jgi:hypothetical protein
MDDEDTTVHDTGRETGTDDEENTRQSRKKGRGEELTEALLAFLGRLSPHAVHHHPFHRR